MTKEVKKEIEASISERKEYLMKSVSEDIGKVRDAMVKKFGFFKKFVLIGESPWNDGEEQYHKLKYSFGYISEDGEDFDDCLEYCDMFSAVFNDFIDEKYQGRGGVWEYVDNCKDNGETHISLSNIKALEVKEYAELLDELCKELKPTNFILTLTYGSVTIDLSHDPDY